MFAPAYTTVVDGVDAVKVAVVANDDPNFVGVLPVGARGRVSADHGNAAATLTVGASEEVHVWNTPLGDHRAVTLSTEGALNGHHFRIVRTAAATGAFNLNVGTGPLKALTAGQWCDVHYDGSAWMLTAAGTL